MIALWSSTCGTMPFFAGLVIVFVLMAIESTFIPLPSEIVIPPAILCFGYDSSSMLWIAFSGGLGSLFGSYLSYLLGKYLGDEFFKRTPWIIGQKKMQIGKAFIQRYGVVGVFFCRLLPVVRHVISIPAGIFKLPLIGFLTSTFLCASLWCYVLAWFTQKLILEYTPLAAQGQQLDLLSLVDLVRGHLFPVIVIVGIMFVLTIVTLMIASKLLSNQETR